MATRFYFGWRQFNSGGQIPDIGGWNALNTAMAAMLTPYKHGFAGDPEVALGVTFSGTANPGFFPGRRYLSPALAAQTISGTIKGQAKCVQTNSTDNYTLAVSVRLIKPDGTERSVLLAPTASDSTSVPPEWPTTSDTNRRLLDASENASISLTSQDATEGDRLEVTLGLRRGSTSSAVLNIMDYILAGATDLPENDTTTAVNAPWIEFSDNITFADGYEPWLIGGSAVPDDNGSNATSTITLTPPTSHFRQGDLVLVLCQSRSAATWSVGVTGGQSWTEEVFADGLTSLFWCTFNGTWSANPRFDSTSSTCTTAAMSAYRAPSTDTIWGIDVALVESTFAAPSSPFTVTRAGVTTNRDNALAFAGFLTLDDNNYNNPAANEAWRVCTSPSIRNTAGSDQSMSINWQPMPTPGATGDLSRTQNTVTGDGGTSFIIAFSPLTAFETVDVITIN